MSHAVTAIVATQTIILLLGSLITYLSFKAYRRTGARALWSLSAGFGVITTGSIIAGVLDLLVPSVNFQYSILLQSVTTAIGFIIITYSLYVE